MMKKPYVIIHTLTSLDGSIHAINLPEFDLAALQYEQLALHEDRQVLNIQGYLNGRITTEDNTTYYRTPDIRPDAAIVPEGDFVADTDASMYYIAIDARGCLGWQGNTVDYGNRKSHVISVLTEQASNGYKEMLRRLNISYIIAGKHKLNNALVLHKLATLFGMERVMIGGGGVLNWSYLQDGLVDELSLLMAPIADASSEAPSLFTAKEPLTEVQARSFTLINVEPLEGGTIWARYKVNEGRIP